MDRSQMGGMGDAGMMCMVSLIPPDLADKRSSEGYAAAMDRMMADTTIPFSGDADVDFVKGMISHHQATIDMAKVQPEFGKDLEIRKLAEAVIAAQEAEIAEMKD